MSFNRKKEADRERDIYIGYTSNRSGILLWTHSRNMRNIIDVCAPRACRIIGRWKLTCEWPENIARIKKPRDETRSFRVKIKIGRCAFVRVSLFFSFPLLSTLFRSYLLGLVASVFASLYLISSVFFIQTKSPCVCPLQLHPPKISTLFVKFSDRGSATLYTNAKFVFSFVMLSFYISY